MKIVQPESSRALALPLLALIGMLVVACTEKAGSPPNEVRSKEARRLCDARGVREVVERLGKRLKNVSLQAPESVLVRDIREVYEPYVTEGLLRSWIAEPASAPGRLTSSPWPELIEISSVDAAGPPGSCLVKGEVIYVTSVELTQGGSALRQPVTLEVVQDENGWRISAYRTGGH